MEIMIAVGLGMWFTITGIVATIATFRSFKRKEKK